MYMCIIVCTTVLMKARRGCSDSMDLELQTVVSLCVGAGN